MARRAGSSAQQDTSPVPAVIPPGAGPVSRLQDGTEVSVRPIEPSDAPALEQFHDGLSPETTRLRFFSPHPHLTAKELARFTTVDHHNREALVMRASDEIIAVGRYDRKPESTEAEVAFVVRDDQQGRGAATILLFRLAERAREEGVTHFVADTLADNRRMVEVFEHTGWVTSSHFDAGVLHLVMDLPDPPDRPG
jgi:GNAT superfamily N-acetyltransferase